MSRRGLTRLWPWSVFFIGAFAVFFLGFYAENKISVALAQAQIIARRAGVGVNGLTKSLWPPQITARDAKIPVGERNLVLRDLRLWTGFFPPAVHFRCDVPEGYARGRIKVSLLGLSATNMDFEIRTSLQEITTFLQTPFFTAKAGTVSFTGDINFNGSPARPRAWTGTADLNIGNGELAQTLPSLKPQILAEINGEGRMKLKNGVLTIEDSLIGSGRLSLKLKGAINNCFDPVKAILDLNAEVRVPPDDLVPELTPKRTLQRLSQYGVVRVRVAGNSRSPQIRLE